MSPKELFSILKQTFAEWSADKAPTLGAALAYYTIFSMAPLLIISIAIAGFFLGQEAAQGQIYDQLSGMIGSDAGKTLQDLVKNSASKPATGIIATVIGLVTLMSGASGVFSQLQASMNTIWGVEPKEGRGIKGILHDRSLSFGFILVVGFLLLVSLILSALIAGFGTWLNAYLPGGELLGHVLNLVVSLVVITLLFAMIFKYLPDAKIAWHDVWIGAFITALLFSLGKMGLGIYLGKSSASSGFGASGSLIVLLLWIYYSSQILFFGAEFTQVYANRKGAGVKPDANAVAVQITKETTDPNPVPTARKTWRKSEAKLDA